MTVFRNPGPISPKTLEGLRALGVDLDGDLRYPLPVRPTDFDRADRAIALSRREHGPMVESFFPAHGRIVEYWEVGDVEIEPPASAIEKMIELTERLLADMR